VQAAGAAQLRHVVAHEADALAAHGHHRVAIGRVRNALQPLRRGQQQREDEPSHHPGSKQGRGRDARAQRPGSHVRLVPMSLDVRAGKRTHHAALPPARAIADRARFL
jgi:hypothetical protein